MASSSPLSYSALSGSGFSDAAAVTGGTASLSGYVYVDVNADAKVDTSDWAIADAKISLTRDGSSDPAVIAYSNKDGSYSFTSLIPGSYSIAMLTPCALPGQDTLGQLRDINGISVDPGKLDNPNDKFYDIAMRDGYTGVNYNFAEMAYPISLVSKRMVINTGGIIHTVPEPGSLVLLVIAGIVFGVAVWRRRMKTV